MALALTNQRGCASGYEPPAVEDRIADPAAFVRRNDAGDDALELMVTGAKCAACIAKIEGALTALPGVMQARLNLSTQRLRVVWRHGAISPVDVVETLKRVGYAARAFDPETARRDTDETGRRLLRYLAVSGFGAMNIMMFTAPVWLGDDLPPATRTLLYWLSALIAIPASLYAAQPFFSSAFAALKAGRANMDVPISLAVVLALGMSLYETFASGAHAYFDGVVMLLFFLLIGRYLDHHLRQRARTAARDLLALQAVTAARIGADGAVTSVSARDIAIGDRVLLAAGDRAPVDGVIARGVSELDNSMLTGETLPAPVRAGDFIHAGAINVGANLVLEARARAADSAVSELARLIETGEQSRAGFVRMADRAAALYVPIVHGAALATFLGWLILPALLRGMGFDLADVGVRTALQNAIAVLIITCPCALGLAVPAVQVVATGRLFQRGVLVKSGDALERLAQVDTIVFDKTGTLTLGKPRLVSAAPAPILDAAAAMARASRHPLARALVAAQGPGMVAPTAHEIPGQGVEAFLDGTRARLGKRAFAAPDAADAEDDALELWFGRGDAPPVRLVFEDALRDDAPSAIATLRARGYAIELLSGDRASAVAVAARAAGIDRWTACVSPAEKTARLQALAAQGHKVLMIGDGLNDAAALAAAHASASPGTAIEATQAAADLVLQGPRLAPIVEALDVAKAARRRVLENLAFSALYNVVAAPAAMAGLLTPLIATLAMSSSSLVVTLNALRLQLRSRAWIS